MTKTNIKYSIKDRSSTSMITNLWYKLPDKMRIEELSEIKIRNNNMQYIYDTETKTYKKRTFTSSLSLSDHIFSPNFDINNFQSQGGTVKTSDSTADYKGKLYKAIDLLVIDQKDTKHKFIHEHIYIDPITSLAKAKIIEKLDSPAGQVIERETDEYEYNLDVKDDMFVFTPPTDARAKDQISNDLKTIHVSETDTCISANGTPETNSTTETWYKLPDKIKVEDSSQIEIDNSNRHLSYNKETMIYYTQTSDQKSPISTAIFTQGFDLSNLRAMGREVTVTDLTDDYKGTTYHVIDMMINAEKHTQKVGATHERIYIDPKTKLMIAKVINQYDDNNRIIKNKNIEYSYNTIISDDVFVFTPPPSAREKDLIPSDLKNIHLNETRMVNMTDGSISRTASDSWYELPDKIRIEDATQVEIWNGEHKWTYNKLRPTQITETLDHRKIICEMFTPGSDIVILREQGRDVAIKELDTDYKGTKCHVLELRTPADPHNNKYGSSFERIYIDPVTKLVKAKEIDIMDNHEEKMIKQVTDEYEYNIDLNKDMFTIPCSRTNECIK